MGRTAAWGRPFGDTGPLPPVGAAALGGPRRGQLPTPFGLRPSPPDWGSRPPALHVCVARRGRCPHRPAARTFVGAHIVRPIMASPFQGEAVERSETDEGAHGGDGWSYPPPPHPSFASQMPPSPLWGGRQGPPQGGGPYKYRRGKAGRTRCARRPGTNYLHFIHRQAGKKRVQYAVRNAKNSSRRLPIPMKAISRALDRFCYNHPRLGIPELMKYIALGNVAVFIADMLMNGLVSYWIAFVPELILRGQVWRLVTFVFVPVSSGGYTIFGQMFFFALATFFYYWIGTALERQWGDHPVHRVLRPGGHPEHRGRLRHLRRPGGAAHRSGPARRPGPGVPPELRHHQHDLCEHVPVLLLSPPCTRTCRCCCTASSPSR